MAGFEEVHVTAALAAELTRLGWRTDDQRTRDLVAGAARGVNLVVETPPAAVHAQPLLAGLLSTDPAVPTRLLAIVPPASLESWAEAMAPLAAAAGRLLHVASGPARAGRLLREAPPAILLTTPVTALALARRSSLKVGEITHLLLAWPELLEDEAEIDALLADLDKDAPRLILTTQPDQVVRCAERFARRALTFPLPAVAPVSTNVRVAVTSHADRLAAIAAVLETFDPAQVTLWTAIEPDPAIRRFAKVSGVPLAVGDEEWRGWSSPSTCLSPAGSTNGPRPARSCSSRRRSPCPGWPGSHQATVPTACRECSNWPRVMPRPGGRRSQRNWPAGRRRPH